MLLASLSVGLAGIARLLVRWGDQGERRYACGMLTAAVIGALFVPSIGQQTIDPATQFAGGNTTEIARDLLTVGASYQWVAAAVTPECDHRRLWGWRAVAIAFATALLLTYIFSPAFHPPNNQFEVAGTVSMTHDWVLAIFLLLAGTLIVHAAAASRAPGVDLPLTLAMHAVLGVALGGMGITMGALLVTNPAWLAAHFDALTQNFAAPGLFALAFTSLPGLVEAWKHRDDPRS